MNLTELAGIVSLVVPITRTGVGHLAHPLPAVEANCDRLPSDLWRLHVADVEALDRLHGIIRPLSHAPGNVDRWVSPIRRVEHYNGAQWDGFVTLHPDQAAEVAALVTAMSREQVPA